MSKVTAIIERWDDQTISIYVPKFEGFNLNGQGKDVDEAKKALQEAVEDYKAMFVEQNKAVPASLLNIEFEYKYDVFAPETQKPKRGNVLHRTGQEMMSVRL